MMRAYYDLSCCPPSFDVVSFLLWVEQERLARGEQSVEIDILPGPAGGFRQDNLWPHSIDARIALRDKVAVPMCRMLPSATRVQVLDHRPLPAAGSIGHGLYAMHFKRFVAAMGKGIAPLRPRTRIRADLRRVTVTLRECEHWPERNSNLAEWLKAADALASRGYSVVFVRDTRHAGEEIPGHVIDPAAAMDLDYRGALYRASLCNFFVSNGPAWFSLACCAPTLILRPVNDALGACYGTGWLQSCGIPAGGQIPNALVGQRLVWADDRCDAILDAFNQNFVAAELVA